MNRGTRALLVTFAVVCLWDQVLADVSTCMLFKDCASCTCNVPSFGFSKMSRCNNKLNCAWSLSLDKCVPQDDIDNDPESTQFVFQFVPEGTPIEGDADDDSTLPVPLEAVQCPVTTAPAAIGLAAGFYVYNAAVVVFLCVMYYNNVYKPHHKGVSAAFEQAARAKVHSVLPGESILMTASDLGTKAKNPPLVFASLVALGISPTLCPVLVWSFVGLPSTLHGGFSFYFITSFVGGMGILGQVMIFILDSPFKAPSTSRPCRLYVLTTNKLVTVKGTRTGATWSAHIESRVDLHNLCGIEQTGKRDLVILHDSLSRSQTLVTGLSKGNRNRMFDLLLPRFEQNSRSATVASSDDCDRPDNQKGVS